MDLLAVMTDVGTRLGTIAGLRVQDHATGFPVRVNPPAAIVILPESLDFDATYQRGADTMALPVLIVVGRASHRSALVALALYCNGSGAKSVKSVLESGTYTAFDSVRVKKAEFDVVTIEAVDYLAALFDLDIIGHGS